MANTFKQISVFLTNKPGKLDEVLNYLTKEKTNILSLNISETDKYGVMRIIVEKPDEVFAYLKEKNYLVSLNEVFIVQVAHSFGSLHSLISLISDNQVNIDYMYSMAYFGKSNSAAMVIAVDDIEHTKKCLDSNGIKTMP